MRGSSIALKKSETWVSTRSTKSARSRKARRKSRAAEAENARGVSQSARVDDFPERYWRIGVIAIFLIAAVLRLYDLNLVPLHHDEGVNGNFLVRLVREGAYQYDPENYHGPTLYYFSALIPWTTKLLFGTAARDSYGLTTFTIRLIPAAFGLATIGLIFLLRRQLGSVATLAAGLMLAVSPGAVYLSRYFIHETLFVFFTLGIVVAGVWFYGKRNPSYLIPAAASAALLFATKETAMISAGVLLIALALTFVYSSVNKRVAAPVSAKRYGKQRLSEKLSIVVGDMGGSPTLWLHVGLALIVFLG